MEEFESVMDHVVAGDIVLDEEGRGRLKDILDKIASIGEEDIKILVSLMVEAINVVRAGDSRAPSFHLYEALNLSDEDIIVLKNNLPTIRLCASDALESMKS